MKLCAILLALALLFSACNPRAQRDYPTTASSHTETASDPYTTTVVPSTEHSTTSTRAVEGTLQVIFLDVGQGDSALIITGEHAMLIDAGDTGKESIVLDNLEKYGVTKLDYLVATHPHADHIGAMVAVIQAMDGIGTMLMPDIIHTTQTYESLLDALIKKDITVIAPQPGEIIHMGSAVIHVLAPGSVGYSDLNNYSIVLRIEFGQTTFLLTGDAENQSELDQLSDGFVVSADVLKVGHHGSNTSTTLKYLEAVSPSYAVISVGKENPYGHPHSEVLSRLAEYGISVYRTDEHGIISFTTDGQNITVSTENVRVRLH